MEMMVDNNKKSKLLLSLIIIMLVLSQAAIAQNICNEEIWMGWAANEYNSMSYGAVANNSEDKKLKIDGYGRYQFRNTTNLIDFMQYADEHYFKKWIEIGLGSERLNDYDEGLPQAWTDYYVDNEDSFIEKQDNYMYSKYFLPIKSYLNDAGISLSSPYLKGAVWSVVMHKYNNNEITQAISRNALREIIDLYDSNEEVYIKKIYDFMIDKYPDEENKKRWAKEKQACLEQQSDEFNSHVGEILNSKGEANSATFIRELNNLNPTIFQEFLSNEKFTRDDVLEWYDAVRTSVNYKEEFGIESGVLDFGTTTSHGINIDNYLNLIESEVVFTVPNNDSNVIYIPQNTNKASYSNIKFGVNNVAQGGASLACMSMVLSKYKNTTILPDELCKKIEEKYGDVNYFYDINRRGNNNEIISGLAEIYGYSVNTLSKNSVLSALKNGNLVIARVTESEFTKHGTFILLCGTKTHNEKEYVIIADPNLYHTRFLYNLYDIDYIAHNCQGIFFEISM